MKKFLQFNLKYFWLAPILLITLAAFGLNYATKLKVNLDLTGLLPENSESVTEMNHVVAKVGGGGYIIVLIGPITNPESKLQLINDNIKDLENIKFTYFEREEYSLKEKALYILPRKEFKKLTESAQILFATGPVDVTGLGLVDESDREDQIREANKFFDKLKNKTNSGKYFLSPDKKHAMLLVRPTFDSTDLESSKKLATAIKAKIEAIYKNDPKEKFPFSLSGRYIEKVEEIEQFEKDISKTGIISNIAIIFLLIWGLGTVRGAIATALAVAIAMSVTSGLAYLFIGQINVLTGFLFAILSGLGSKFGIHLIRRYYQEKQKGLDKETALRNTYFNLSRKALLSSALTSSCSFFILAFSKFRGFSELGIIAGTGILVIYFVFVLAFPLIVRFLPDIKVTSRRTKFILGKYPVNYEWFKYLYILIPILLIGLTKVYFEYNFEKLHNFPPELQAINELTDKIYGRAISPSAISARDKEQVLALSEWLREDQNDGIIDQLVSVYDLVPEDMQVRYNRIQKLRNYVYKVDPKVLESKTGMKKETIYKWVDTPMYDRSIIPIAINENFGKDGNVLIVFPKENQNNYQSIMKYADLLTQAKKEFPGMEVGSDTLVFAEILKNIIEDGKIVLLLFLVGAFLIFYLDFKNVRDAISLELQLVLSILFLLALMGIIEEPFTILNVAMIPEVLAAGIDMAVHIRHREKEGYSPLESAGLTAHAVQLGGLTSILGFGSLLFASSKMLHGIAWISILGQISSFIICMMLFPLMKTYFSKKQRA